MKTRTVMQQPSAQGSGLTVCFADILWAKAGACPCCERRNGPQMLSGCYEIFVERLLLFLLGFLCLLCLLRFLGHVTLRGP